MNLLLSAIILIILLTLTFKMYRNIRALEVSTKKTIIEKILIIISIIVIGSITVFYAKGIFHYIIGAIAITYIILQFFSQGISEAGIITISRGKDIYKWKEIYRIEIIRKSNIKLTCYCNDGFSFSHKFSNDKYDEIIRFLKKNKVLYKSFPYYK